jgi:hypothetical protein
MVIIVAGRRFSNLRDEATSRALRMQQVVA